MEGVPGHRLSEAHGAFDAAAVKRDEDMRALEDRIKTNELHWVSEMTRGAEASAKAQREMIDKVSRTRAPRVDDDADARARDRTPPRV